jgi:phosphate starvation-inducible PhoH-like protein
MASTLSTREEADRRISRRSVPAPAGEALARLLGSRDETLRAIEARLPVRLSLAGQELRIDGEDPGLVDRLADLLGQLLDLGERGRIPLPVELGAALDRVAEGEGPDYLSHLEETICVTPRGKAIRPRTQGQKVYLDAIRAHDVTFAVGPAGTGKTYLAVAQAVAELRASSVARIVLVRPVVEAGERLGYLPGDLLEKVEPYLRPLYDAFYDLLTPEKFLRHVEKGIVEIAPLAYMRGRTLNESFIILDEAQNTTPEQMKMFLTRLGFGSRAVITGDVTQVDLPAGKESGLKQVQSVLEGIGGIAFVRFSHRDVIRHPIVQKIVKAYEDYEQRGR